MVCVRYSREKSNKWLRVWDGWKPFDLHEKPWLYFRGNIRSFGFWSGLKSNITLSSPLINKLWNWKYRNMRLSQNIGGVLISLWKLNNEEN
jgi:hypothetical protein